MKEYLYSNLLTTVQCMNFLHLLSFSLFGGCLLVYYIYQIEKLRKLLYIFSLIKIEYNAVNIPVTNLMLISSQNLHVEVQM